MDKIKNSRKTLLTVNKFDLANLHYEKVNEDGFLVLIVRDCLWYGFEKIFIRNILKCFGNNYKIIDIFDIEPINPDIFADSKIITNLPYSEYENILNKNYFETKIFERNIIVNKDDIKELGNSRYYENNCYCFEFSKQYEKICLIILKQILKCFGDYKIINISESYINGGMICFDVKTNLSKID